MVRFSLLLTTSLALGLAASSCSGGWEPSGPGNNGGGPVSSLVGIGVGPDNPTVTLGEAVQFRATGFYDDLTTRDITDSVDWHSTAPEVLGVSNSLDTEGLGESESSGQTRVGCSYFDLVSNEVRVTVTDASLTALEVVPSSVQLHSGGEVQLEAEAEFSDGSHGNVSGSVRWITGDGAIATVDTNGKVTGGSVLGTTTVRAVFETGTKNFEGEPALVEVVDGSVIIDDPDVRILGVSAASSGGSVQYTIDVKNSGGAPASALWVDVWLNRTAAPPPPPASGDGRQLISLLGGGESTEVTVVLEGVSPGTYQSWVLVDSLSSVFEGSLGENNNLWGPEPVEISGSGGPIGADLSITYLQAFVQAGQEQVLYIIDVTNTGDTAAPAFVVGVFANPEFPPVAPALPDEQVAVETLLPGDTAYLSLIVRDLPEPWWQSYVLADSGGSLAEPNESNNLAAFQVVP